uniref:Uncharacterized protein n=1 Tax=Anopheles farauti TaxID=69004 RepID=A0A182Q8R3_9DIPT
MAVEVLHLEVGMLQRLGCGNAKVRIGLEQPAEQVVRIRAILIAFVAIPHQTDAFVQRIRSRARAVLSSRSYPNTSMISASDMLSSELVKNGYTLLSSDRKMIPAAHTSMAVRLPHRGHATLLRHDLIVKRRIRARNGSCSGSSDRITNLSLSETAFHVLTQCAFLHFLRKPKVNEHVRATVGRVAQEVARLHVPVDHAVLVHPIQRDQKLLQVALHLGRSQLEAVPVERFVLDERHHQPDLVVLPEATQGADHVVAATHTLQTPRLEFDPRRPKLVVLSLRRAPTSTVKGGVEGGGGGGGGGGWRGSMR